MSRKYHLYSLLSVLVLVLSVFLNGCAVFEGSYQKLPREVQHNSSKNRVVLKSVGQILVLQEVKSIQACRKVARNYRAEIVSERTQQKMRTVIDCRLLKDHLVVRSRSFLKEGRYQVSVHSRQKKQVVGKPVVSVRYRNPEFNSGDDQNFAGAIDSVQGQKLEGEVDYGAGDRSDWVRVKGENVLVAMTLMDKGKKRGIVGHVYAVPVGMDALQRVGTLIHGKRKRFRVRKDNLYVKVVDQSYSGTSEYSLLRTEAPAGRRRVSIPVIDFYQVDDVLSIALLEAIDGIKLNAEVLLLGKKASGKLINLGICSVTMIEGGEASCELGKVYSQDFVEYQAKAALEG